MGIPKVRLPIKWIVGFLAVLILIGAAWFVVRSYQQPPYDDSALWSAINSMNSSITSRNYIDSNFNNLGSRIDQVTTQITSMKSDIASIKVSLGSLNRTNPVDYSARLTVIENRLTKVETTLSQLGNLTWISGFPTTNSSTPSKYLCDTTGVPTDLLFQYNFACVCSLRKTYGPYLNVGAACMVNRDTNACSCYSVICNSEVGLC